MPQSPGPQCPSTSSPVAHPRSTPKVLVPIPYAPRARRPMAPPRHAPIFKAEAKGRRRTMIDVAARIYLMEKLREFESRAKEQRRHETAEKEQTTWNRTDEQRSSPARRADS